MDTSLVTLTRDHPFVRTVVEEVRRQYGERLISLALFGSVARGTARPNSDLDLFIVIEDLPRERRARLETFDPVEDRLAEETATMARSGIEVELSPVLRTPEDLKVPSPLLLDLTEDAIILQDRGNVLGAALDDLRGRLRRLGSRRIWVGTRWYWDLKPDYQRGEIIEL